MDISPANSETICKEMILLKVQYCSKIRRGISYSLKPRPEKLQNRAVRIINKQNGTINFPCIHFVKHERWLVEVFKCLNGLAPLFKLFYQVYLRALFWALFYLTSTLMIYFYSLKQAKLNNHAHDNTWLFSKTFQI